MQFLKDLFNWFLHGGAPKAETPEAAPVSEMKREKREKKEKVEKPELNVVENILSEAKREDFLEELQSIKPASKQFDKDRADLIQEVKRLSSPRKRA